MLHSSGASCSPSVTSTLCRISCGSRANSSVRKAGVARSADASRSAAARTTEDITAQPLPFDTQGYWSFDDCDPGHAELQNAHPLINTAFRSVGVTCTPGLLGTAVALAAPEDIVYVPDQPYFVFDAGV